MKTLPMLRRGLRVAFALAMAAAAPLPMLACDLPTAQAECHRTASRAPEPQPQHCETVPAPDDPASTAPGSDDAADNSCCVLAPAPVPEAPGKADAPAPAASPDQLLSEVVVVVTAAAPRAAEIAAPIVSLPDRQPVLCTFLI